LAHVWPCMVRCGWRSCLAAGSLQGGGSRTEPCGWRWWSCATAATVRAARAWRDSYGTESRGIGTLRLTGGVAGIAGFVAKPAGHDAGIAEELSEIQKRLASMVVNRRIDPESVSADLVHIRADLRRLAGEHAEIQRRVGRLLKAASQTTSLARRPRAVSPATGVQAGAPPSGSPTLLTQGYAPAPLLTRVDGLELTRSR
jgi:hypothetical protein